QGAVRVMLPPDLARGPWIVTATMRSGLVERVAKATLTFPDAAGQIADEVLAENYERRRSFLIPFAFWLLLLTMLALLATWRLYASEPSRPRPGR
ncbi:MAG: hypothetical protein ACI970_000672, partial [Myxococcota bacterium]